MGIFHVNLASSEVGGGGGGLCVSLIGTGQGNFSQVHNFLTKKKSYLFTVGKNKGVGEGGRKAYSLVSKPGQGLLIYRWTTRISTVYVRSVTSRVHEEVSIQSKSAEIFGVGSWLGLKGNRWID